jgi:hypothetical protein
MQSFITKSLLTKLVKGIKRVNAYYYSEDSKCRGLDADKIGI